MGFRRGKEEYGDVPEEERLKAAGLEGFFMRVECAAERLKVLLMLLLMVVLMDVAALDEKIPGVRSTGPFNC